MARRRSRPASSPDTSTAALRRRSASSARAGKSGSLSLAAAAGAGAARTIGVVPSSARPTCWPTRAWRRGRARRRPRPGRPVRCRRSPRAGPADVTVVCVDVPGCEGGAILSTAQGGTVIFFSMATSFTAAALGAEGLAVRRHDAGRQRLRPRPRRLRARPAAQPRAACAASSSPGSRTRRQDRRHGAPGPARRRAASRWQRLLTRSAVRDRDARRRRCRRLGRGGRRGRRRTPTTADDVVDLDGRLVTPGFVDAHVHLAPPASLCQSLDLSGARRPLPMPSTGSATYAAQHHGPVLFAHGWDESRWPEQRHLTARELDQAVGDVPAYVVAGRRALGRRLVRPARHAARSGRARRLVATTAGSSATPTMPSARSPIGCWTPSRTAATAIRTALRHAAARGVTSVHELNAPHIAPFDDFALIAELTQPSTLPGGRAATGASCSRATAPTRRRCCGLAGDLCVDGAIGSRTAAMHEPYADARDQRHLYLDRDQSRDHVVQLHRARPAGRLPRHRRPGDARGHRGLASRGRDRRARRRRARPAPARARRDARRPRTSPRSPSSASWRASSRRSTPPGAAPASCTRTRLGADRARADEPVRPHAPRRRGPRLRLRQPDHADRPVGRDPRRGLPPRTSTSG